MKKWQDLKELPVQDFSEGKNWGSHEKHWIYSCLIALSVSINSWDKNNKFESQGLSRECNNRPNAVTSYTPNLAFIAHLLVLTNLCLTFSPKLFLK